MRKWLAWAALVSLSAPVMLAQTLEERVRESVSIIWIHGITQELADERIGAAGVPYLLELLNDPDFERRDNVVAFLGFLAHDTDTPELLKFLDNPPVDNGRPEEQRALLLVPQALGYIAAKTDGLARAALESLEEDTVTPRPRGLRQVVDYGLAIAAGEIDLTPRSEREDGPSGFEAIDPETLGEYLLLTWANHVDANDKITAERVDDVLYEATRVMGTENSASDTGCCIELRRSGGAALFGNPGDGLDVITSNTEMTAVLNNGLGRVKVVDSIQWCGGPGANIIGCGFTPGNGVALVRLSDVTLEGILWAHEFGHNTGLGHSPTSGFIMSPGLSSNSVRLSSGDCNRYHTPSGSSGLTPFSLGSCNDDDDDGVVSTTDNCLDDPNFSQNNSDTDEFGDVCDNCEATPNPDQGDCDQDGFGDACDNVSNPPDPAGALLFENPTKLTWPPPFNVSKNVYRGSVLPGDPFVLNQILVETLPPLARSYSATSQPGAQQLLFYLVTQFNGCGESE